MDGADLPDGKVSDGEVLGLEDFPVVLLDGVAKVGFCVVLGYVVWGRPRAPSEAYSSS